MQTETLALTRAPAKPERLLQALKEWHPYTFGHCLAVEQYAAELANCLNVQWTPQQLKDLQLGARLHDLGKLRIELEILDCTGKLSVEQFAQIKTHPGQGVKILAEKGQILPRITYEAILFHHTAYARGGVGYPEGLWGEDIPLAARIVAVADIYDALTTKRSYKAAFPIPKAVEILQSEAGKKLDPYLVQTFIQKVVKMAA